MGALAAAPDECLEQELARQAKVNRMSGDIGFMGGFERGMTGNTLEIDRYVLRNKLDGITPNVSQAGLGGPGNAQQHCLPEMRPEDLQTDG